MNEIVFNTLKEKDYIVKNYIIKAVINLDLELNDLLLLIYFTNQYEPTLNVKDINKNIYLKEEEIMESFSKLVSINLLTVNLIKDENGITKEVISLDNLIKQITSLKVNQENNNKKENIFDIFEHEFGRTLSPIEYEIINEWINNGTSEKTIIDALKEAVYNGAKSLRYVNKIILSWQEKGIKSKDEKISHEQKESDENGEKNLFDYNWLDEK